MAKDIGRSSDDNQTRWPLVSAAGRAIIGLPAPVQVLIGILTVQIGAAVAKQVFPVVGAAGVVTMRLLFGALILSLVWRSSLRISRQVLPIVFAYGVVLGAMNLFFYLAIARIPLGIAVTIEFLGPLTVALVNSRRWLDGLWAVLAAGGVALLAESRGDLPWEGIAFALAAAVCWACYILLSAALGSRTTTGSGLAFAMGIGAVVVAPVGIVEGGTGLLTPWVLLVGLAVALLSSVIPYSLELEALRSLPPRVFGVLMSLEPAAGALAGLIILGEWLQPLQWLAVALVVIASIGATRSIGRQTKLEPEI